MLVAGGPRLGDDVPIAVHIGIHEARLPELAADLVDDVNLEGGAGGRHRSQIDVSWINAHVSVTC